MAGVCRSRSSPVTALTACGHIAHDRVIVRRHRSADRCQGMEGGADESRMLAAAIIMQRARSSGAAGGQRPGRSGADRPMRPAFETGSRRCPALKPAFASAVCVCSMAPTCEAQASASSGLGQSMNSIRRAADSSKRQRLQRLHRRARDRWTRCGSPPDRTTLARWGRLPRRRRNGGIRQLRTTKHFGQENARHRHLHF